MAAQKSTLSLFEQKLMSYLAENEDAKDVTFLVGSQKKEITALKIVLQAACPALDALFKNNWSKSWEKGHLLVSLPDVDPVAFQLFLEILLWDGLDDDRIQKLNLPLVTITHLVVISKKLQMTEIYELFRSHETNIKESDEKSNIADQCKSLDLKILCKNKEIQSNTSTDNFAISGQAFTTTTGVHTEGHMSVAGDVITVIGSSAPLPGLPVTTFFEIDPPTPSFTGRANLLRQIHSRMEYCSRKTDYVSRIVVICGLGGIGKTEIARMYARKFKSETFIKNVAWIDAETRTSLKNSFDSLASSLNLSTSQSNLIDVTVGLVYQHFSVHIGTGLFIFDNAPQFNDQQFKIYDYLPKTESLKRRPLILITARDKKWEIPKENIITVEELSDDESVQLFSNKLDLCFENQSSKNQDAIRKLARSFQGFPLGLSLAASNIDFVDETDVEDQIEDYLRRMETPRGGWGKDMQTEAATKYHLVMQNVWEMTLKKIKDLEGGDDAISLLSLMAFSPTDQLTIEVISDLFQFTFSRAVPTRAFFILEKKSMISLEKMPHSVSVTLPGGKSARTKIKIHRLVQHCTRESLELEDVHLFLTKICHYVCTRKLEHNKNDISALLCAHEHLRARNWPQNSICYSVIFCSLMIFFDNENSEVLFQLVKDVANFLNIANVKLDRVAANKENGVGLFCLCVLWINKQREKYPGYEFLLTNTRLGKSHFKSSVPLLRRPEIPLDVPNICDMELDTLESYMFHHCYQILQNQMTVDRILCSNIMNGFPPREDVAAVGVGNKIYSFGGFNKYDHPNFTRDVLDVFVLNVDESEMKWRLLSTAKKVTKHKKLPRVVASPNTSFVAPNQRYGHSAVAYKESVFIFGGNDIRKNKFSNSTYRFDTVTLKWDNPTVSGKIPEARSDHSAVVIKNSMIVFGGKNYFEKLAYAVHCLDLDSFLWSTIEIQGISPSRLFKHSATVHNDRFMLIFGGKGPERKRVDTILSFDYDTKVWSAPETSGTPPSSREDHCAFMHNGQMYIFGGYTGKFLKDLFFYNPETFQWKEVPPIKNGPFPRKGAGCVVLRDLAFIFGGIEFANYLDVTSVLELKYA